MEPHWSASWVCGLPLIALTMVLHIAVLGLFAALLTRARRRIEEARLRHRTEQLLMVAIIGGLGAALALLHGVEAGVWAGAYLMVGAIDSPADAMLYSIDSITTRGASGITLAPHWRMMGALEASNGMLLFGISTAFLAVVLSDVRLWFQQRAARHGSGDG